MAKASEPVLIPKVLEKLSGGGTITLREAQTVARAAVALRDRFHNDLFKAMQNPSLLEPGQLECIAGLAVLLYENGFLSPKEAGDIQKGFEMLG